MINNDNDMFSFSYKNYSFNCDIGTMTPYQYIVMICTIEALNPSRICELGSGVSTKIFDEYIKKYGGNRYSIESDSSYANNYNALLMPTVVGRRLKICGQEYKNCVLYEGFEDWLSKENGFDFIFIDGPNDGIPTNDGNIYYSRIQLLDFVLMDKLNNGCTVMYHDSERDITQHTLNEFERLLKDKNYKFSKEVIKEFDKEIIDYNNNVLDTCPELTKYKIWR